MFLKISGYSQEKPVLESLFNKVAGLTGRKTPVLKPLFNKVAGH